MRKWRWVGWFLVAVLLLAVLAPGCVRKEAAPKAEAKMFRRAFSYGADPGTLDPILASRIGPMTVIMGLFDGLVAYDPIQKKIVPDIADKWDVSSDGKTYTFYLHKGVKFHNGREVEARDFKFSLERILDPANASPFVGRFKDIVGAEDMLAGKAKELSGVEAPEKYVLKITLARPNPIFLMTLTSTSASVVPREEVEKLGKDFGSKPVGSGPFVFESWKKDDRIVVKANEGYWRGRPKVDGVEFRVLPEAATREAEFLAGNLDYIILSDAQYRRYSQDPKWKDYILEVPELFTRHIGFNTTKPPFDKKEVRQAFCYAIDTEAIIKNVVGGKAFPAVGVLPNSSPGFNPDLKGYTYDPEKAKELLAQAGYPKGFEAEILCTENPSWGLPAVEAVMQYLSKVGITLKPSVMDGNTMLARLREGNFQCYMYSVGGEAHPLDYVYYRFHSQNATGNYVKYANPDVDRLLDEAMATNDWDTMVKKVQEAERLIVADAPWWFFNYNKAVILRQPWVEGLIPNPTDLDLQFMENVSLGERPK
ncbi:MAG: ABC transporter substrate-binding protein [Bacillota bacterium]|nr:ABC transporter substrate-binding protein [Bacillota bacterium]